MNVKHKKQKNKPAVLLIIVAIIVLIVGYFAGRAIAVAVHRAAWDAAAARLPAHAVQPQ